MDVNYENIVTELIANSGMARSCLIQAIRAQRAGDNQHADQLVLEAEQGIQNAHEMQTELIRSEVEGEHQPMTLLMVHAQDHLMTAMTLQELTVELIAEIRTRQEAAKKVHG